MPSISKSRYLSGLQCPLLLWTHYNDRGAIPRPDAATQWIFDRGHQVGDLAKKLWPDGIEVPHGRPQQADAHTRALLPRRIPIFEASFLVDGRYCRVDILEPTEDGRWNLIEVKSSTRVKPVNLHDVAFQADALERAGLELGRLELMHLDREYRRQGRLEPERLFHHADITAGARALQGRVTGDLERMQDTIAGPRPTVPIGPHCDDPYSCNLKERCWAGLPEHHVTTLHYAGKTAFPLAAEHGPTVLDLPQEALNDKQRIQQQAIRAGKRHVDRRAIRRWLDRLRWPVHHLDFETMSPAVPIFDGTRPYQRIPFQFSLHVQSAPGAPCEHHEFLSMEPVDPPPGFLESLATIGPEGSILVYNIGFERGVLKDLARDFPSYRQVVDDLIARMVDLADPFRAFDLYDAAQLGRYSLKNVLPAWTGLSYDDLTIGDGQEASREYERAVFGGDLGLHRDEVAAALREYCRQDTWAMVELLRVLDSLTS